MTQPAIHVRNLCKQYGQVLAVDNISFDVAHGELVGFLGLNGAGKTTTMRILTTFMPASSGFAAIAGFDVMYQSMEVRKILGYLPESVPMYPEMRVEEYLQFRAKLKQVERTVRTKRIDYCLERCRINEVRRRLLGTLSKGYRQRVGLADTMLADPKVLILDEPLSGLDPVQQDETLATIRNLGQQHTVLFSSHQLKDVEKVCDRVIIINRGRKAFDDRISRSSALSPTLVAEIRGPREQIGDLLKKTPHVSDVEYSGASNDITTFTLEVDVGHDIRESLVKTLVEKGWGVLRLTTKKPAFEDTFKNVVFERD